MLIRYKKSFKKIAMGLLSLMPSEKNIKKLTETIDAYENDSQQQLYLWKDDEEYVGIVGVRVKKDTATIQHICVLPSYRSEGVATKMIQQLLSQKEYEHVTAEATIQDLLEKCTNCKSEY